MSATSHTYVRATDAGTLGHRWAHRRLPAITTPLHDQPGSTPWRSGWIALILTAVSRALLVLIGSLVLWSVLPVAFGWNTTVVMSGSMEPRLHTGDVVVSRPIATDRLRVGQVLLVADPDHAGRLRLHRLASVRADGTLTLRGDANGANDSTPVPRSGVRGVGALRSPYVGSPVFWAQTGQPGRLVLSLVGFAGLLGAAGLFREDDSDDDSDDRSDDLTGSGGDDEDDVPTGPRGHRLLPGRNRAIAAMAATLVTGFGLAAPATATPFGGTATNNGSDWSAATYFTCASAMTAPGPYYLYKLADSSGTVATDSSGSSRNGTYQGTVTRNVAGPCSRDGSGVTLNGSSAWVSTPTLLTGPNVFSTAIWFRTTTTRGGELIGFGNAQTGSASSNDRHLFMANSGQLVFGVYPNAVRTITSPKAYNDNTWHFATATLSTAGMRLYVDGALVASDTSTTTAQSYNGYFRIGYNTLANWGSTPTSEYFAGSLADAAVYGSALTAAQVSAIYDAR